MVFVYGTLRCGGSNHWRMAQARFVAKGLVRGRLYRIDWFPGIVTDENAGPVMGEVYMVDAGTIAELDDFEGRQYRRVRITVDVKKECSEKFAIEAWIWEWLGEVDECQRIACADWLTES